MVNGGPAFSFLSLSGSRGTVFEQRRQHVYGSVSVSLLMRWSCEAPTPRYTGHSDAPYARETAGYPADFQRRSLLYDALCHF
jgi:hypothetical protein